MNEQEEFKPSDLKPVVRTLSEWMLCKRLADWLPNMVLPKSLWLSYAIEMVEICWQSALERVNRETLGEHISFTGRSIECDDCLARLHLLMAEEIDAHEFVAFLRERDLLKQAVPGGAWEDKALAFLLRGEMAEAIASAFHVLHENSRRQIVDGYPLVLLDSAQQNSLADVAHREAFVSLIVWMNARINWFKVAWASCGDRTSWLIASEKCPLERPAHLEKGAKVLYRYEDIIHLTQAPF